ncbi:MAG: GGDEF domain-containing protein [Inquilinus sp.]|nr:GGDEF domain-containing protein [Inquilinus sp.]
MASPIRSHPEPAPALIDPAGLDAAFSSLADLLNQAPGAPAVVRHALEVVREAEAMLAAQRQRIAHLEHLSATDDLTGLGNRRGFLDHLRRHLAAAKRHGETGVLALCDLDHLKQVNDRHGHPAGDAVLRQFAEALRRNVRETDVVARLGGDEFAILLTRCRIAGGMTRIETLAALAEAQALVWRGTPIPLRVSVGAVSYDAGATPDALIAAADARLYECKAARRDQRSSRPG